MGRQPLPDLPASQILRLDVANHLDGGRVRDLQTLRLPGDVLPVDLGDLLRCQDGTAIQPSKQIG